MPRILIPAAYIAARALWHLGLRDVGARLAARAWLAEVAARGGPSVRD